MKTMVFTMFAAAFMLVAASAAYSAMSSAVTAIDSNNRAVVSISEVSTPITTSARDTVSFDSNGLWLASDYSKVSAGETAMASREKVMERSKNLYCFDSASKFCAVAY